MAGQALIFCLSQHHTGTWSTLAWLIEHQGVEGFLTWSHLFDCLEPKPKPPDTWIQPVHPMESGDLVESFHPLMVFHEHIRLDSKEPNRIDRTQVLISTVTPTVIPIRDPLASLISYQVRAEREGTGTRTRSHVDEWVALAQTWRTVFQNFAHVRFLPWDLLGEMDLWDVADTLVRISQDLGLRDANPSMNCARKMIHNNDLGLYGLKQAYQVGDLDTIKGGVSEGAVNYLISKRRLIKPFLKSLGYSDLMWWS